MISQAHPPTRAGSVCTTPKQRCRLFIALMDRACRLSALSRRQLARQLGVAVGSVNNYYLGKVDPLDNRLVIQQRLAELNGVHLEGVVAFYESGDWGVIEAGEPRLRHAVLRGLRPRDASARSCPEITGWSGVTSAAMLDGAALPCPC